MVEELWKQIYEYKEFICVSTIVILLCSILIPYKIKRFNYKDGTKVLGFYLFQMKKRQVFALSFSILEFLFVLCAIFFCKRITVSYFVAILLMHIVIILLNQCGKRSLFALLHAILLFAGLLVGHVMFRYLKDIMMEPGIVITYIALNLFLILYSSYICLDQMQQTRRNG